MTLGDTGRWQVTLRQPGCPISPLLMKRTSPSILQSATQMKTLVLLVLEESMDATGSCVLILEMQVLALPLYGTHGTCV